VFTKELPNGLVDTHPTPDGGYEMLIQLRAEQGSQEMRVPLGQVDEGTARQAHDLALSMITPGMEKAAQSSLLQIARVIEKEFSRKAA
jgi:hypothetical protein